VGRSHLRLNMGLIFRAPALNTGVSRIKLFRMMQIPPAISKVVITDEVLGFHLEDGRFISVPLAFYPTLALATAEERAQFEISGSSVYWPVLDADIGVDGLLAGAREHHHYARQAVERAVSLGRLPRTALEPRDTVPLQPA
jgi:hypothetical protein